MVRRIQSPRVSRGISGKGRLKGKWRGREERRVTPRSRVGPILSLSIVKRQRLDPIYSLKIIYLGSREPPG
jgi:hypothetical protein